MPPSLPLTNFTKAWDYWLYRMESYVFYNNLSGTAYGSWNSAGSVAALRSAGATLFACINNMFFALTNILNVSDWTISGMFQCIHYAGTATGSVDMDAILNAMLTADFDQLRQFVGIEDAYRSALWDQPFNAEFYAALARGFMP